MYIYMYMVMVMVKLPACIGQCGGHAPFGR